MRELNILATWVKFHTLDHSSPLSPFPQFGHLAPPIWPSLPDHIFIRISDKAVQSYFSSPISIGFTNMSEGKSTNPRLQKVGQIGGRETGSCCDQVCERIFLKWPKSSPHALLIPIISSFWFQKICWLRKLISKLKSEVPTDSDYLSLSRYLSFSVFTSQTFVRHLSHLPKVSI